MWWVRQHLYWQGWPHREQARSHRFGLCEYRLCEHQRSLWEPACWRMRSVRQHLYWQGWPPSRAGSLPQFLACVNTDFVNTRDPCGSGLARDGIRSGNIFIGRDGPIAGKPAPTVFGLCEYRLCEHQRSLWEPACWRMWWVRQHLYCLGRPHREQARSHSFWPV